MAHNRSAFRNSRRFFVALAAAGLLLSGCGDDAESAGTTEGSAGSTTVGPETGDDERVTQPTTEEFLDDHGLANLSAVEIVDKLDTTPLADRPTDLIASVRPDEIVFTNADEVSVRMPMPEDKFYLSFAPYKEFTHDCYYHSLTTCVGEMQNAQVKVTVVDDESGEHIVDETMTTFDNGFLGVWLPRGIDAELTVEADGLTSTSPISTKASDDLTCLTTLPLS